MPPDFLIDLDRLDTANSRLVWLASLLLRLGLAAAFLWGVTEAFGVWELPGMPGIGWRHLADFNSYLIKLNSFVPPSVVPALAGVSTMAEAILALGLIIGWKLRWVALASAILLFSFAAAVFVAIGPKAPLGYCVFSASAGAFLLFAVQPCKPSLPMLIPDNEDNPP